MMNHLLIIGKKQYPLRFTVNSVCCLEEQYGKGLHSVLCTDVLSVRALLWCALLDKNPHMTLEDAGKVLDEALTHGKDLSYVAGKCADALKDAGFFRHAERR
ncbi:MAG: hypothetical protein IKT57_05905 [Clostridia bacterium]|nr:hypothetical protein [Clostridia bacterium]